MQITQAKCDKCKSICHRLFTDELAAIFKKDRKFVSRHLWYCKKCRNYFTQLLDEQIQLRRKEQSDGSPTSKDAESGSVLPQVQQASEPVHLSSAQKAKTTEELG